MSLLYSGLLYGAYQGLDYLLSDDPEVNEGGIQSGSTLLPFQQDALEDLIGRLQGDLNNIPGFGEVSPGLVPLQTMSLAGLERIGLEGLAGGEGSAVDLTRQARGTLGNLLDTEFDEEGFNDFFEGAVETPATKSFERDILPDVRARNARGFFGSQALNAEARARGDFGDSLTQNRSQLAFDTQQSQLDRALRAAGISESVAGGEQGILGELLALGAIPRGVLDEQFEDRRSEFVRQQNERARRVQELLAASSGRTVDNIGFSGFVDPGNQSTAGSDIATAILPILLSMI